jgi:PAS domain S-box-containing protein
MHSAPLWLEPTLKWIALISAVVAGIRFVRPHVVPYLDGIRSLSSVPHMLASSQNVESMQKTLSLIAKEVMPNGGTSLRDSVSRSERKLDDLMSEVLLLSETRRVDNDTDPNRALFDCDETGMNVWVNKTYCRWLQRTEEELLGWGFLTFVAPYDRERVRDEWEACREERRQYVIVHDMIRADGAVLRVEVTATPIPNEGVPKRWIGTIRKMDDGNH